MMISLDQWDLYEIFGNDCGFTFKNGKQESPMAEDSNNPYKRDSDGDTLLHLLVSQQRFDLVESFFSKRPDIAKDLIDAQNNAGQTPLHLAIVTGLNTTVTLLIQHKVNVTVQNNEKETPYHLATKLGKNSCLKLICEKASVDSLNLLDGSGKSALHWAIETQNMEAFDVLLGKGVDVNLKNGLTGQTSLHYAVQCEKMDMIRKLLDNGADVKAETNDGDTPLHLLTSASQRELAALLLEAGADINVNNRLGKAPYDLADKTLQRFLKRNRKDRKIRKRKVKSDATAAVNESQSSEKLEPNGTGSWNTAQSCGKFLSFSGTPAEKKAMREEDQNGRAFDGDSLQRELLREVLNDTDLTELMRSIRNKPFGFTSNTNSLLSRPLATDGTIDMTSRVLKTDLDKTQNWPLATNLQVMSSGYDGSAGSFCPVDGDIGFQTVCTANAIADLQQQIASTLSMQLTPTVLSVHQTSPNIAQDAFSNASHVQQTEANTTSMKPSLTNTAQRTLASTIEQPWSTSLPLHCTSIDFLQSLATPVCKQETSGSSVRSKDQQMTSTFAAHTSAHSTPSTEVSTNDANIDRALEACGLIDNGSRELAKEMPAFINVILKLSKKIGVPPADVMTRYFSLSKNTDL